MRYLLENLNWTLAVIGILGINGGSLIIHRAPEISTVGYIVGGIGALAIGVLAIMAEAFLKPYRK